MSLPMARGVLIHSISLSLSFSAIANLSPSSYVFCGPTWEELAPPGTPSCLTLDDIITMDYRVRGFTRELTGRKLFIDHEITSIQDYIAQPTLERYDAVDINVYQANLFHTRMLLKEVDLQNYLFNTDVHELPPRERLEITASLRREMIDIFSGKNVY